MDQAPLRKIATKHAYKHARILLFCILYNYFKKRKEFGGTSITYRYKVILKYFDTHLGNDRDFWHPLFKLCFRHVSYVYPGCRYNELWDIILPIGDDVLKEIREKIQRHFGDHAYHYDDYSDRRPILYEMPPYIKPDRL